MRLGFIGPGTAEAVRRVAEGLLREVEPDRIVYLGGDDTLDQAVLSWGRSLVGDDPTDEGIWSRAAAIIGSAGPHGAIEFVRRERARLRLRKLEQLPLRTKRATEWVGERSIVFIDDKERLDQHDLRSSSCFIFGRSDVPIVKRVASRWFLSPGAAEGDTALVLQIEGAASWQAAIYKDAQCTTSESLHWTTKRKASPPPR